MAHSSLIFRWHVNTDAISSLHRRLLPYSHPTTYRDCINFIVLVFFYSWGGAKVVMQTSHVEPLLT